MRMPRFFSFLAVFLPALVVFLWFQPPPVLASSTAEIFYSEACSDCVPYLEKILKPTLSDYDIKVEAKDYINNPQFRPQLSERITQEKIPQEMVGHMMTFVKLSPSVPAAPETTVVLAGHVPPKIIKELLQGDLAKNTGQTLVIWQDEMHGEIKNYRLWAGGEIKEYSVDFPVKEALKEVQAARSSSTPMRSLLPAVIISGFLDGLNPCAFAILLFLIAFIFMLKKSRLSVLKYSLVYIGAIYLTYLLIGLGLWKAILITGVPHLMAKVGSVLVIILGGVNILNYFFPKMPISLRITMPGRQKIMELMHKGTLPTTLVLGILVGLCTFPCSGGIYVAIVTLLAVKTTFTAGLFYLLIYNLMFILPLFIILALAGNRVVVEKLTNLEEQNEPRMRLIYGIVMVAIGILILLYFV